MNNPFPKLLSSQVAFDMAQTLLQGFMRHYSIFRDAGRLAKEAFENQDWHGIRQLLRDRITFYDQRVIETAHHLEEEFDAHALSDEIWQQVKLHYIGPLSNLHQPELAETFFNSVTTRILASKYFNNKFIFVRPTISTEYLENDEAPSKPSYRAYYPGDIQGLQPVLKSLITSFDLKNPFENLDRDLDLTTKLIKESLSSTTSSTDFQIHALSTIFFRNKTAYIMGRIINGERISPLVLALMHNSKGELVIDGILLSEVHLRLIFSFTHSYFLVDMEVPSAYVTFMRSLLPHKPRAELYNMIGLQKHGKNLFYRDFQHHLMHSTDQFRIAPGIRGLVMLVFDLPSYPYVFKLIKDYFPPPKETSRNQIMAKYQLVKQHDRVGRMADSLEFSNVAFPLNRFTPELLAELEEHCASLLEFSGGNDPNAELVIKHLYIERRMTPLNIRLQEGSPAEIEDGVIQYGEAIKNLIAANIFPGDLLYKNFGVTRYGRVAFYDYDEIEYLTDCEIREVPAPRNEDDEMASEPWYRIGPKDIFPETYKTFLLGNDQIRDLLLKHHADLFQPTMWQSYKNRLLAGEIPDFIEYDQSLRLRNIFPDNYR
jgi:isocitrate dehydrogenase kinase/phosphatase